MVLPVGLEPTTPSLEGRCSIQLSYGRKDRSTREKEIRKLQYSWEKFGLGSKTRTYDFLLPKQMRYQLRYTENCNLTSVDLATEIEMVP
jgi:hypothetical protein